MAYLPMISGGGANSIKDAFREKVFNGTWDYTYSMSGYNGRASVNEGRIVVDTTNKCAYLYADFECLTTQGSSGNWDTITVSGFSHYYPANDQGSTTDMPLLCDDSSTVPSKRWCFRTDGVIANSKGDGRAGYTAGDHYIVYGAWTY